MRIITFLLFAFLAASVSAQQTIYVGIGYGSFDYEETGGALLGNISDSAAIKKLLGGFEMNDYFTLEMKYAKTDTLRAENSANVPPFGVVSGRLETDFTITSFHATGQIPFDWGAFMGGLGFFSSNSDFAVAETAACCGTRSVEGSISDNGLSAMLGLEWRFGRFGTRYGFRLEYEWWNMDNIDTSAVGLAFSYGF